MQKKKLELSIESDEEEDIDKQGKEILILKETNGNQSFLPLDQELKYPSELENTLKALNGKQRNSDLSYHWFSKVEDLAFVAKPILINSIRSLNNTMNRDIPCEFKLLKLITEDKEHKENFLKLPKNLNRLNRYNDIIPCKLN